MKRSLRRGLDAALLLAITGLAANALWLVARVVFNRWDFPAEIEWLEGGMLGHVARIARGEAPRSLDKEFLRGWLLERGWKGDGPPPHIPDEVRAELAERYLELYRVLIGKPLEVHSGPVLPRVEAAVLNYLR